uniref:Ribose-phosphate pyrophosphokinase N-terminal domain-containing protein n=1 Tax=Salix viminalis TaxID=40686 RepID=A0A6N2LDV5_SALVM
MTRSQGRFYLLLVRNPALLHVVGPVSTALDGFLSDLMGQIMKVTMVRDCLESLSSIFPTFDDGFPNLFIPNAHGIRGQHVAFLASFSSPKVIFEQLSIIYALPKLFISSFTLVLPFFPTGTSERMEDEGDVATAFTLARILSNIPASRGGPTSLVTFDIHALQERYYFGDNILPCFESGIPLLKNRLQELPDSDNIAIAFPDDGAWKRFHKQLQHFPTIFVLNLINIPWSL